MKKSASKPVLFFLLQSNESTQVVAAEYQKLPQIIEGSHSTKIYFQSRRQQLRLCAGELQLQQWRRQPGEPPPPGGAEARGEHLTDGGSP